jgi:hypothetical protein
LLLNGVREAKMYKWVDQNGVLQISSSPPVEFSDVFSASHHGCDEKQKGIDVVIPAIVKQRPNAFGIFQTILI